MAVSFALFMTLAIAFEVINFQSPLRHSTAFWKDKNSILLYTQKLLKARVLHKMDKFLSLA
ncbi:MAG: hypothetical protein PUP91_18215 [Rhizonema sp. PD37]|nr:hypothetical protein [Rhizonema sp. PD37]